MKTVPFVLLISFFNIINAIAAEPAIWSVNSRAEIMRGDARGVSIDADGTISPSPRLTEVFKTGQQYVWSSAIDRNGNVYLGTGGEGRIFKIGANGSGAQFADLAEMNVSALAVGSSGEIYAATSPDGKVYRLDASGSPSVYFDPKQKYIWSLAVMPDGSLAVGTGDGGRIYKVRSAGAAPDASLLFDTSETNITALAVDKQGNLYAGTDPGGIVMRFGADGKPFGLLDSRLREVHSLDVGPDGSVYALVLGEPVAAPKAASGEATGAATPAAESKTVSVSKPVPGSDASSKSRYDLKDAKSAVYHIATDGGNDLLWASNSVIGFSLHAHQSGNGVLVGTSDKGRIYNVSNDGRETLIMQTDASQISTLAANGNNIFATSSNQGSLYRIGPDTVTEGTYDSAVLDAKSTATWGRIWWRSSGNVTLETRTGNTELNTLWSLMFCPKCGSQNPETGRFCRGCGSDLGNVSHALAHPAPQVLDRKGRPVSLERAIVKMFTGVAFIAVSVALAFSGTARDWWFWLLIPAFTSLGAGVAQFVQLRRSGSPAMGYMPTGSIQPPPINQPLPPAQTQWAPPESRYKTGDLVPPSVTDATTRHLEMDPEGKTMTLPKKP